MEEKLSSEIYLLHDQICDALGNPCRVLILYTLRDHPRFVTDIADELAVPQSSVSRHLKVLRDRGLVYSRRKGAAVYYALGDPRVLQALDLLRGVMTDHLYQQLQLATSEFGMTRQADAVSDLAV
ncbi:MAG: winged helix-turn-helix transcriptional regulator [Chloroflexi bacterium]|nr:winged helix-turn-helix transcriptional regulator [Chloroflexota bacterium]